MNESDKISNLCVCVAAGTSAAPRWSSGKSCCSTLAFFFLSFFAQLSLQLTLAATRGAVRFLVRRLCAPNHHEPVTQQRSIILLLILMRTASWP